MKSQEIMRIIEPYLAFNDVEDDLRAIFATGRYSRGGHCEKFVESLVQYTGARHCFLTTSATTALHLSLKVLGIAQGDHVAVADFSYPATAHAVETINAVPVFVDVDIETFNMSSVDFRKKLAEYPIKAVIFVDAFGNPSGLLDIIEIAAQHGIPVIEDAACSIGSSIRGKKIGAISTLTCFSFHPRKLVTTGEGGAILTNRSDLAVQLEIWLNQGIGGKRGIGADFVAQGYNFRMSEIQALMGWKQLENLDYVISRRQAMASNYVAVLEPMGFHPQRKDACVNHNIQSVVFRVPENQDRDNLVTFLNGQNIETTLGTYSLSNTTYYKKKYNSVQKIASSLEAHTITLPCHDRADPRSVGSVLDKIIFPFKNHPNSLTNKSHMQGAREASAAEDVFLSRGPKK